MSKFFFDLKPLQINNNVRKIAWFFGVRNNDNKLPRYRLYDTWVPEFDSELTLAVSSFYADEAFHEVFGGGQRLLEKEVLWYFIGYVLRARHNPMRHVVTVRCDKELKAIITGSLTCGQSTLEKLTEANEAPLGARVVVDEESYKKNHADLVHAHSATRNDFFENRIDEYSLALNNSELSRSAPIAFRVNMIAVGTDEQGKGHLRAMLDRIIDKYGESELVEFIEVTTYDNSKKELYMHLGFVVAEEIRINDMCAWRLTLPLL